MPRATSDGFRIDLDLDHARREADRVRNMLQALRRQLSRVLASQTAETLPLASPPSLPHRKRRLLPLKGSTRTPKP